MRLEVLAVLSLLSACATPLAGMAPALPQLHREPELVESKKEERPRPRLGAPEGERSPRLGNPEGTLDWPLKGVLYARFGKKGRGPHDGIDLAAPLGTPVRTAAEGRVLFAGEQKGYGLIAIVEHSEGLVTLYAHNRDLRVKQGQQVRGGQVIATVGESGRTSGPHLHFEVRRAGRPVDPLAHLRPGGNEQAAAQRQARRAPVR